MTPLRLGAFQLSPAESGLIRALTQLFASGDSSGLNWAYVDAPPYDVLVIDASTAGAEGLRVQQRARWLLAVCGQALAAGPDSIERPIRRDNLVTSLLHFQRLCLHGDPVEQLTLSDPAAGSSVHDNAELQRYKLRRWPPAELLHKNAGRVRMATLISKRPMLLSEIVELSGQPEERCRSFIQLLQGFNLVEAQVPAPVRPTLPRPADAYMPAPVSRPRLVENQRWNLVKGIRQRLGL